VVHLILIRHGDAYAGFDGLVSGPRGCRGLTDLGRRQAVALGSHLAATGRIRADVLLTSVLPRAIETAQIIAPALGLDEIGQRCDLCEIHTGEADGLEWTEYAARYGSFDMEAEPARVFAPGGDSWTTFHARVRTLCQDLATEFPGKTVVAVCHAGVIMASIRVLFGIPHPGTGTRLQPTNTGITDWEHEEAFDRWTLRSFNEQTHLLGVRHHDAGSEAEETIRAEGANQSDEA
jgi:probable phosphoglycerate mutase